MPPYVGSIALVRVAGQLVVEQAQLDPEAVVRRQAEQRVQVGEDLAFQPGRRSPGKLVEGDARPAVAEDEPANDAETVLLELDEVGVDLGRVGRQAHPLLAVAASREVPLAQTEIPAAVVPRVIDAGGKGLSGKQGPAVARS